MLLDIIKTLPQYLLPQHLITLLYGTMARCTNRFLKNILIHWFVRHYQVDMREAQQENLNQYVCFNDFFTRKLKNELRPIALGDNVIVSPVDGIINDLTQIKAGKIYHVKNREFSLCELLGGDLIVSEQYAQGSYMSLYLSPRDYHRVHMPISGRLTEMIYIPGKLFSVNPKTQQTIPQLFAKNERVILKFETKLGPMMMILVGAMIVASISTTWHGTIVREKKPRHWHYPAEGSDIIDLDKGAEVGYFSLGSTVILLFPDHKVVDWEPQLQTQNRVRYGETIAITTSSRT